MGIRGGLCIAAALVVASCSGSGNDAVDNSTLPPLTTTADSVAATDGPATTTGAPAQTTTTEAPSTPADAATVAAIEAAVASGPDGCDPLDTRQCVLPFPSDAYLVDDASTPSGHRVAFPAAALPTNAQGVTVDPAAWNREDGFSANASLLTYVADLDPTNLPTWTDLGASLDDDATVVLVDTSTGERVPLWAEPDAGADDPTERLLVIHPAISLAPETTYAVALRDLRTTAGAPIAVSPVFTAYRDRLTTDIDAIESRRPAMEDTFAALEAAGVGRADLQLAWNFTTASTENTTAPILKMRDETMTGLGDSTPEFEITSVTDDPEADGLARFVEGVYSVPNYLTGDGSPGSALQRRRRRPTGAEPGCGDRPRTVRLWHLRNDDGGHRTGPPRAVRTRVARLEPRSRRREHRRHVERAQHRVLRHEVGRLQRGRHPHRGHRAGRHVDVPDVRRPDDPGAAEPARARPADARRQRSDQRPRIRPARRHPADRQQHAGLRRQQSGRDHGPGARRHLAGFRAGGARRGRHELLDAAPPVRRLRRPTRRSSSRRTRARSTASCCCRSSR